MIAPFFAIAQQPIAKISFATSNGYDSCLTDNQPKIWLNGAGSSDYDSFLWEFGDGNTESTTLFPNYGVWPPGNSYPPGPGSYEIILTVFNSTSGLSDKDTLKVNFYAQSFPEVDFNYTLVDNCVGPPISFNGAFNPAGGPPVHIWDWELGDGNRSAVQSFNHSYAYPDSFIVALTAINQHGCVANKVDTIVIEQDISLAEISSSSGCPCNDITFNASGTASFWNWAFGDGESSTSPNTTHQYDLPDLYNVSLTGTDANGCSYTKTQKIEVCPDDTLFTPSKSNMEWHFGTRAGINFSSGTPVTITTSQLVHEEGNATMSHPVTGALLFYTDGDTIWDANNNVMQADLLPQSYSSAQSSLIIPFPGNEDRYYVFNVGTFEDINEKGTSYSVIDMTLNGGLGGVVPSMHNVSINDVAIQRIAGVTKKKEICTTPGEYWVVTSGENRSLHANLVTESGIAPAVISILPEGHVRNLGTARFSPDGTRFVIQSSDKGSSNAIVMTFDKGIGNFFDPLVISSGNSQLFDANFSPDGTKLYTVVGGDFFQYNLLATDVAASEVLLGSNTGARTTDIGPDGKMYVSRPGSFEVGVINAPNEPGLLCNYIEDALPLTSGRSGWGVMQNIIEPSVFIKDSTEVDFEADTTKCLTVRFTNKTRLPHTNPCSFLYNNDTLVYYWDFGDGTTSNESEPTHVYPGIGNYTVKLKVERPFLCRFDSLEKNINLAGYYDTIMKQICIGDSLFVGGAFQKITGFYDDSFVTPGGCDSNVTTNLIVGTTIRDSVLAQICSGESLFAGGALQTDPGIYYDTITVNGGCDSIRITNLTTIAPIINTVAITGCDSILLNNKWYFNSQTVRDTLFGAAASGCDSIVNATLTITNRVFTATTITRCGAQLPIQIHGIDRNQAGTYEASYTATNGCDSVSSVTLQISAIIENNQTFTGCDSVLHDGAWHKQTTELRDTIFGGAVGGCDSVTITSIVVSPSPDLAIQASADSIIAGKSVSLTASGADTYSWDNGDNGATTTVSPGSSTSYCVTGSTSGGNCLQTICMDIEVVELNCFTDLIFIPTGISPNGDGINDELCVFGRECLQSMQLSLYDRWGNLVYRSEDSAGCWDGTFKNKPLNSGVFIAVFNGVMDNGEPIDFKKNISIIR